MTTGDIVKIANGGASRSWRDSKWDGLRCEVLKPDAGGVDGCSWLRPLTTRPDGHGLCAFYWPDSDLETVQSETESLAAPFGHECPPEAPEADSGHPGDSQGGSGLARGQRMDEYGHPSVAFARIAELWSIYLDGIDYDSEISLLPEDVAKMMILLKVSRLVTDNKADTLDDIDGYVECLRMLEDD